MAIGFKYNLGVNEAASLKNLEDFLSFVESMDAKISLDFDLSASSEMLDELQKKINQMNSALTLDINNFNIDSDTIQKELNKRMKDVKLVLGVEFDSMSLKKLEKDGGATSKIFNSQKAAREAQLIKDSVIKTFNSLGKQLKDANLLDGAFDTSGIEAKINSLQVSNLTAKSFSEMKLQAKEIKNEISGWQQAIKLQNDLLKQTSTQAADIRDKMSQANKAMEPDAKQQKQLEQLTKTYQRRIDLEKKSILMSRQYKEASDDVKQATDEKIAAFKIEGNTVEELAESYQELHLTAREIKSDLKASHIEENGYAFNNLATSVKNLAAEYLSLDKAVQIAERTMEKAWEYVKAMDEAYTDVAISMDVTKAEFSNWTKTANEIAQANGITTESVMEMVKIYAQAGQDMADIEDKLAGTTAIQNITGWDAAQTTAVVNSIINQFKLLDKEIDGVTGSSSKAIEYFGDALVGISNALSVDNIKGIQEMASAIDDAGSVIESTGGTMEWFMAVTSKLVEATNMTGSEIGGAMRMIAARTLRQGDMVSELEAQGEDLEITMAKAEKALQSIGVTIRGETMDELRSLEDILGDVAGRWDTLSDSQRQAIGEAMAGTQRSSTFQAIMQNYQDILELQQIGLNSSGELMRANEIRAESLKGKVDTLKAAFERFYDLITNSELIGTAIDFITAIVNGISTLIEKVGSAAPVLGGFFGLFKGFKGEAVKGVVNLLATKLPSVAKALGVTATATKGVSAASILAKGAMGGLAGILGGVALTALINFGKHLAEEKERLETMPQAVEEYKQSFGNMETQVTGIVTELEKQKRIMEDTNSSNEQREEAEAEIRRLTEEIAGFGQTYKDIIDDQNLSLDTQIAKLKEATELEKRKALPGLLESTSLSDGQIKDDTATLNNYTKDDGQLNYWAAYIDELQKQIDSIDAQMEDTKLTEKELKQLNIDRNELLKEQDEAQTTLLTKQNEFVAAYERLNAYQEAGKIAEELGYTNTRQQLEVLEKMKPIYEEILGIKQETAEVDEKSSENTGSGDDSIVDDAIGRQTKSMSELNEQYVDQINYLEEAQEIIDSLADGLSAADLSNLLDSDVMDSFTGSINDVDAVLEHVKGQFSEMQDAAYETAVAMQLSNEEAWNNITQTMAESLNLQVADFQDYVNDLGGLRTVDIQNAQNSADAQLQAEMGLTREGAILYAGFINSKAGNRKVDMGNVVNFLNSQGAAEAKTVGELAQMWADYYNAKKAEMQATLSALKNQSKAMEGFAGDPTVKMNIDKMNQSIAELDAANTAMVDYFANVNTSFSGVTNGLSQALTNAGNSIGSIGSGKKGGSGGSNKGGGGSGSSSAEQQVEDMESLVDAYYEVSRAYNQVENALELNNTKQEKANGRDKAILIQEEIDLLKQKSKVLLEQKAQLEQEAKTLQKQLSQVGFTFDNDGNITNYKQKLENLTNWANSLTGDSKKEAIEQVKSVNEAIERYTTLMVDEIAGVNNEWESMATEIREVERELAEDVTDFQKDVSSAIENELEKRYNMTKEHLEKEKDLYNQEYEQDEYEESLANEQRKLDEIQQQINDFSRDNSEAGKARLQQLMDEYAQQQKAINDMIKQNEHEKGNELFDQTMDSLDQELEEQLTPENLANMVNQALVSGFATIGDETIQLNSLMNDWLDETGDGLYAIGALLKSEVLDNMSLIAQLYNDNPDIFNGGLFSNIGMVGYNPYMNGAYDTRNVSTGNNVNVTGGSIVIQGGATTDAINQLQAILDERDANLLESITNALTSR